jgi:hypothetical protein
MKTRIRTRTAFVTVALLAIAGAVLIRVVSSSSPDLRDPRVIRNILGYDFEKWWRVQEVEQSDSRYYWAIDGGISDEWIESIAAVPDPLDDRSWRVIVTDGQGVHLSRVFIRCEKGCCVGIEAEIPKESRTEHGEGGKASPATS